MWDLVIAFSFAVGFVATWHLLGRWQ